MNRSILQSLQWRYATKKFDPSKKLSEEKLNVLKESFNLTATSYGLQPLKLVIVNNEALQAQLVPLTMEQVQVRDASHVLVFCIETAISKNYITDYFDRVEHTRNTPRAILKPFEKFLIDEFAEKPEVAVETWMQKQAYIAMGNLLTVCALEGIDACPIEGFLPEAYDELLQLKSHGLQSVLVMPVGYRAEDDFFADLKKVRRGVDEVVIEIK
ncbi:MAG: NAD(P)H-dependent oxidoreductase [Altibacter sp.]|uniref:NAD(P)H-dependent oxidoreductase n=1 Tax=Altibacter sp. TaxID=2024823 RepID=UPI000C986B6E|nr:NAD(P)H-dependent oxidoreductase [Altibacter sp.]MAP56088.1 NAD(P)H-dependent oxidoreductase [Altibacter sp.]